MTAPTKEKQFPLRWQGLSKNDTTVLKAVGITLILLHNFFHLLPGWMIENEFSFSSKNFNSFRDHLSLNGYDVVGLLFAYLGHYGVQLFVFLSAYGLYSSYQHKPLRYGPFISDRLWKLWPTFFLAVLFFLAFTFITTRTFHHPDLFIGILLRLTFVSNLVPGESLTVVGPWWFYSMIFQFYLIFPLLRKGFNKYGLVFLVCLSLFCLALVNLFLYRFSATGVFPIALVIGHMSVICLGLALAKYKNIPMPIWVLLVALAVLFLSNWYMKAWLFSRICVTIFFLYGYVFAKQVIHIGDGWIRKTLFFVGDLSMYLFAVNGFLRAPFLQLTEQHTNSGIKFLILVVYLSFVAGVAMLLRLTEKYVLQLLSNKRHAERHSSNSTQPGTLIN